MKIILRTLCGCSREYDLPHPPEVGLRLTVEAPLHLWQAADLDDVLAALVEPRSFPTRIFEFRFQEGGIPVYLERPDPALVEAARTASAPADRTIAWTETKADLDEKGKPVTVEFSLALNGAPTTLRARLKWDGCVHLEIWRGKERTGYLHVCDIDPTLAQCIGIEDLDHVFAALRSAARARFGRDWP